MIRIKGLLWIIVIGCLIFLPNCATVGGFEIIMFPTSKQKLEKAIDWSARGYDFLESRLFYLNTPPQELYYVSFVGDSTDFADTTKVCISFRSVTMLTSGWKLEKNVSSTESRRIEARFRNEIVDKLEAITGTYSSVRSD